MNKHIQSPLVTIIIPTYNYGKFIGETILSIQTQTYDSWECVIVDDGSDDDTQLTVQEYAKLDERIKYVRQENQGVAIARNTGISLAQGAFIQFLDADDKLENKKLELQVEYLLTHQQVDIVFGDFTYFGDSSLDRRWKYAETNPNIEWKATINCKNYQIINLLLRNNVLAVNAALIRRSVIDQIGYFDQAIATVADWDFWLRAANRNLLFNYYEQPGTAAVVRIHDTSMSSPKLKTHIQYIKLRHKWNTLLLESQHVALNNYYLSDDYAYCGILYILLKKYRVGVKNLYNSLILSHSIKKSLKWIYCYFLAMLWPKIEIEKYIAVPIFYAIKSTVSRYYK